jgi:MFS family permease
MLVDRLPRHVWNLSIANLLADISGQMIHAVLPIFIISTMQGGAWTVGLIEGMAAITLAIVRVFSGSLSDYLRMQKGMAAIGFGLSSLMIPVLSISLDPLWLILSQFGDRIGQGMAIAPRKALMADVTTRDLLAHVYRLRQSLLIAGACIGSILAGLLLWLSSNNFRLVFSTAFIPSCMALAVLIITVRPSLNPTFASVLPAQMTGLFTNRQQQDLDEEEEASDPHPQLQPIVFSHTAHFSERYWVLLTVSICFYLGNSSDAFLLLRSIDVGIMPPLIPIGLVIMNLLFALISYPVSAIVDRGLKVRMLIGGLLLHGIVYFGFAAAFSPIHVWILFGIYGIHLAMTQNMLLSLVHRSVKSDYRVSATNIYTIAIGIALLVSNCLAGLLWDNLGAGVTFAIGAFFPFFAILILLLGSED